MLRVRDLERLDVESLTGELDDVMSRGVDRLLLDLRATTEGSPRDAVRVIESLLDHRSLLVMGLGRHPPSTLLPGVLGHLVRRAAGSVLVVPQAR